jgi:hypothetical protein
MNKSRTSNTHRQILIQKQNEHHLKTTTNTRLKSESAEEKTKTEHTLKQPINKKTKMQHILKEIKGEQGRRQERSRQWIS